MTQPTLIPDMDRGAILSPCGVYRYALWRIWDKTLPKVTWIMLNPSTADAEHDDPTIRKCIGFSKQFGYGGFTVLNLFSRRATDPDDLVKWTRVSDDPEDDAIPPPCPLGSDWAVYFNGLNSVREDVICAWGTWIEAFAYRYKTRQSPPFCNRDKHVLALIPNCKKYCLGITKGGFPRHPLYVAYKKPLVPFKPEMVA